MKGFDDFRKTIDLPRISAHAGSVAVQSIGYGFGMDMPADELPLVAARAATEATMACLERYHSWLALQLQE